METVSMLEIEGSRELKLVYYIKRQIGNPLNRSLWNVISFKSHFNKYQLKKLFSNVFQNSLLEIFSFIIENGTLRQVFDTILGNMRCTDTLWGLDTVTLYFETTCRYKCFDGTSTIHFSCFTILYCPILDLRAFFFENRISICLQYLLLKFALNDFVLFLQWILLLVLCLIVLNSWNTSCCCTWVSRKLSRGYEIPTQMVS